VELKDLNIPDLEKAKLIEFMRLLTEAGAATNHDLKVKVVGGVLEKPWPRKDIDLLCTMEDMKVKFSGSELDKAILELEELRKIATELTSKHPSYKILEVKEPYMQHFENPDILESRGSISVKAENGPLFDIIGGLT